MDDVDNRSDAELLAAHRAGEGGAFDGLVRRHAGGLYGFLFRFVNDSTLADDLVQETFLQVHLAADAFDLERPFKPWLYAIAANKARDLLRSRARRPERSIDAPGGRDEPGLPAGEALEAAGPAVREALESDELRQRVRAVIATMPEHLRLILMLGYYQHLPYAEIAEILNIPVGTVKSRLHSAIGHFARLWRAQTSSAPAGPQ